MNRSFAFGLLLIILCGPSAGCRKRSTEPPPTNPTLAPIAEPAGPSLSPAAEKELTEAVQAAIGEFQKQHRRYPKDVAEIQSAHLLELIQGPPPGKRYVINPTDGRFSVQAK